MCDHKTAGRWGRTWDAFSATFLTAFIALEGYGLITDGPDATYSNYLRRRAGLLEPCAHSRLGRMVILTAASWLAVHLGFGRLGAPLPRRNIHREVSRARLHYRPK